MNAQVQGKVWPRAALVLVAARGVTRWLNVALAPAEATMAIVYVPLSQTEAEVTFQA